MAPPVHRSEDICAHRAFPPLAKIRRREAEGAPWGTVVIDTRVEGEYRPDVRGPLSLFSVDSGFAEVGIAGRTLPLAEQTFALSPAGEKFTLVYPEQRTARVLNVYFADHLVEGACAHMRTSEVDRLKNVSPLLRPTGTGIRGALDWVRAQMDQGGLALEEGVVDLLVTLVSQPTELYELPLRGSLARADLKRRLARTLDYLVAYSDRPLTLSELARECGVSKFHFLRMFRTATGSTPSRFITSIRIERAKTLLMKTKRSVTEIALDVGFAEQSSFTRAFGRHAGVTPRSFREQALR